ncbi:unnamed protein product [Pleuronectes platessa]|uniref:Uncharacterized protein n=1 Tax=Pleuronectes platessa TaxID=8262 RepID=A0A9N7YSC9_PLEPL|nr:unnamed protein product [Pleuronectes platessa]
MDDTKKEMAIEHEAVARGEGVASYVVSDVSRSCSQWFGAEEDRLLSVRQPLPRSVGRSHQLLLQRWISFIGAQHGNIPKRRRKKKLPAPFTPETHVEAIYNK